MSWKAFIVVLGVALPAFWGLRLAFGAAFPQGVWIRWGAAFIAASFAAFMIPNYWLSLFLFALIAIVAAAAEKFPLSIYALLLFAFPAAGALVPGFFGINNFLMLFTHNVLAIVLLFPMFALTAAARVRATNGRFPDAFFTLYILVLCVLAFRDTNATNGLRNVAAVLLSMVPQYIVFSRTRWTIDRLRLFTGAFVASLSIVAAIACIEVVLSWPLYLSPLYSWNLNFSVFTTMRGGVLRAAGSTLSPIGLGMFLVVALSVTPALIYASRKRLLSYAPIGVLGAGLIATFSRGPWIGAGVALAIHALVSARPLQNLMRVGLVSVLGVAVLLATPYGDAIIGLLPGFGNTIDQSTIDYREELWDRGWRAAMRSPFFGSEYYLQTPEMSSLRQGQGIIDIVNGYLHIALESGLVGLTCFIGLAASAMYAVWRAIGPARRIDPELALYAESYLSGYAAMMLVIVTASIVVGQIQEVIFMLAGLCVGIARTVNEATRKAHDAALAQAAAPEVAAPDEPNEPAPPKGRPPDAPDPRSLPAHLRQYARRE